MEKMFNRAYVLFIKWANVLVVKKKTWTHFHFLVSYGYQNIYNNIGKPGTLVHVYNPSTQGRGCQSQGQCGLHNEILCLTKKTNKRKIRTQAQEDIVEPLVILWISECKYTSESHKLEGVPCIYFSLHSIPGASSQLFTHFKVDGVNAVFEVLAILRKPVKYP